MTAPLHVDPAALHAAAAAQSGVAQTVADLDVGGVLAGAAAALADLRSGSACRSAAESLGRAASTVYGELVTYASNLTVAATSYRQADEELGARLGDAVG
ncbi:type VII secretion target [Mycobacterium sp. BMJ-28]